MTRRPLTATAVPLLAASLLGLAGCASTVDGSASSADGGAGGGARGSSGAGTVACDWSAAPSANPYLIEVPPPAEEVPAEGRVGLRLVTDAGEIPLTLARDGAPCAVASLVHLTGQGFFDGSPCHRQTDTEGLQVLQCGDPTGTGAGGPTYTSPTDVSGDETYPRGTVAMANSGQGFDGSQFFLVWGDSRLPPAYTVVGTVDDAGLAVLDAIAASGNDGSNGPGDGAPAVPVTVESVSVGAG
ncbi:peptidylprolyl isomerase [Geodermatophilus marinus]|uniref:peptidylprolyl isomerase n=1 Tax=Geodermatophilus sp. LHW52908 TaxID=2303986 RepID=UPI000E3E550D|nr:peptidylprolyl isomerase [Geodermatophilus sp. LHW52908]RFU22663.1 peptidylprolyl isomerase [Geodermatophilus sp. LHW52908]